MTDSQTFLAQVQNSDALRGELAKLLVDQELSQPLAARIDVVHLASILTSAFRDLVESPIIERELTKGWERLESIAATADESALGEHVPMTIVHPLQRLLDQPTAPSRDVVAAVLDHEALHQLIREMLTHELSAFGSRVRSVISEQGQRVPGGKLATRLVGMAKGVASVVGSELERQIDDRVQDFVLEAIRGAMDRLMTRISGKSFSPQLAKWRIDVLHALLQLPVHQFVDEILKYGREEFVQRTLELLEAVAQWEGLESTLSELIHPVMESYGDKSAANIFAEMHILDRIRPELLSQSEAAIDRLVENPEFARWLDLAFQTPTPS